MRSTDSMSRRAVLLGGLAVPLLAACGEGGGGGGALRPSGGMRLVAAEGVERVVPPAGTDVAPTVDGMTSFGHDLMGVAASDENFVMSPLSLAYAFGMARAGARGGTAGQIDKVLGFADGQPHPALNALTRALATADHAPPRPAKGATRKEGDQPQPPVVALANGLFAQQDFDIRAAYLRTLAEQYGAGVHTVDFRSETATKVINDWVREQTARRISKLFETLEADTALVLANAVYLKADWAAPFEESATRDDSFTTSGGGRVTVPMMSRQGGLRTAVGAGWQAAELPYAGDELAMWVVVPTGSAAPTDLLAPETLRGVGAGLRTGPARIVMPRWDFATNLDLKPLLVRLGMTVPFSDTADFSGIARNISIGSAVHRANITVDEWGTEAAAVTGIRMRVTSAIVDPSVVIRADRPFAFAVVHRPTRAPLFVGQVTDPTRSAA